MTNAESDAIPRRAFFAAMREGDLDTVRRFFEQRHVRDEVAEMNATARNGGDHDTLWLEGVLHGDFVVSTIVLRGHVELLGWIFSQELFMDTLRVLTTRVALVIVEQPGARAAAREMLEIVLSSVVYTTSMNDHERHDTLTQVLNAAAANGSDEWLEPLLAHGADANRPYAYVTPLFAASEGGTATTVRCLAANGAVVTQSDLVTQAVWEANYYVVRELIRLGADPRSPTIEHNAPLLLAADYRFLNHVKLLVREGIVDIDARDNQGRTSLLLVAADEQASGSDASLAITKFLLKYGVNLFATDDAGSTVLHWAARTEDVDLLRALLEYGCDPNARNHDGCTPLREFGECRMADSVQAMMDLLLQCGADPFIPCHNGQSAADMLQRKRPGREYVQSRRQFFRRYRLRGSINN